MRIVQLLPHRAASEQNALQEMATLRDAGYEVIPISAPRPGVAGIVWLETIGARKAIQAKPDIVSARDLDALGAGVKVKRRTDAALVYDMHEVYPYMVGDDVPAAVVRYATKREQRLLLDVDLALASDAGRAQWLADQGYVYRPMPIEIVLNCRDPLPYVPPPNIRSLCYTGTLHPSRFIREMVEAMDHIDGTLTIAGPDTPGSLYRWLERFGCGPEGFYEREKVMFLRTLSPKDALGVLQRSDVSIQMADPASRINRLGPYNRLFDAMAAGRPSIGTVGTENGNIISNLRIGVVAMYNPESYVEAARAFFELSKVDRERMGTNAYEACKAEFNWGAQAKLLVEAFERIK